MINALEWLITTLGFVSTYLISRSRRSGWIVGIVTQVIWVFVAAETHQYAFVLTSIVSSVLSAQGWLRWRRTDRKEARCADAPAAAATQADASSSAEAEDAVTSPEPSE